MLSLIYVSTVTLPFSADALDSLAEEAATKNAPHDITGLLAYNGFNFMQLLEGDAAGVDDRMARIKEDPRHSGLVVIRREETQVRECADWAMTARITPLEGLDSAELFADRLPGSFRAETRRLFSSFASLVR